jgi:transposase
MFFRYERGKVVLRKALKRAEVMKLFSGLPACLVGMEACGGAHYWARQLMQRGQAVKLMAPQFVKPYVKTNKSDARDAEAICEVVTRPTMRFVLVKDIEQQTVLALHRARQGFVVERTAQGNQMRGLLYELGIRHVEKQLPEISRSLFARLFDHFRQLAAWLGPVTVRHAQRPNVWLQSLSATRNQNMRLAIGGVHVCSPAC